MRTGYYFSVYHEFFAKYKVQPEMPHLDTCKVRVKGTEVTHCTWCYRRV